MMQRQKDMEATMLRAHRDFINNLEESLKILEQEIQDAGEMENICTDEWCYSTEVALDEMHKQIYSISEPRFLDTKDSEKIKALRKRVKDLYVNFQKAKKVSA